MVAHREKISKTWSEYGRGVIGGIIFSLPLLYTMEVWWTGFIASSFKLLMLVLVTYLLLLGYNSFAGMKKDASLKAILWDSVEEIFLALLVSTFFLLMIHKIGFGMSIREIAGKVIVESLLVAIGISVGKAQLGQSDGDSGSDPEGDSSGKPSKTAQTKLLLKHLVLSICGAVLISSNVAPTEEILIIAMASETIHLLIMVFISLLMSAVVLYFSNFKSSSDKKPTLFKLGSDLTVVYISAFLASVFFLWIFDRIEGYSFYLVLSEIIVLSIPASLGASAGSLLIGKG